MGGAGVVRRRARRLPGSLLLVPGGDNSGPGTGGRRPRPAPRSTGAGLVPGGGVVHGLAGHGVHPAHRGRGPARCPPAGPAPVSGPGPVPGGHHRAVRPAHRGSWRSLPGPVRPVRPGRRPVPGDPHRVGHPGRPRLLQRGRGVAHGRRLLGGPGPPTRGAGPSPGGHAVAGLPVGHPAPALAVDRRCLVDRVPILFHLVRGDPDPRRTDPGHPGDRGVAPRRVPR